MQHRDNTYSELACLYGIRHELGHFFKSVTIRLNGIRITVHTAEEAEEILQAYPDIYQQLRQNL